MNIRARRRTCRRAGFRDHAGRVGERVVAYIDQIGRIDGTIVRIMKGGFAMTVNATLRKKDKLAGLDLPEDRRHDRLAPRVPFVQVRLPDGRQYRASILDMSLSGAALALDVQSPIGSPVMLGKLRARVVRHFEDGIGIEFATIQTKTSIEQNLG